MGSAYPKDVTNQGVLQLEVAAIVILMDWCLEEYVRTLFAITLQPQESSLNVQQ